MMILAQAQAADASFIDALVQFFAEPLTYQFMQRALLAGLLVGLINGVIGTYVVVRGMSFFGDALAHSVLPGVAVAYIITGGTGIAMFFGGLVAAIISALIIGWLTRDNRLKEDTAIGIVFAALFALGIAIISSNTSGGNRDLVHILFGNILGIRDDDLIIIIVVGAVILVTVMLFFKELMVISFDETLARTLKLPSEGLRILLLILIAVTIIASLQIVGVTLMMAMLIIPPAIAQTFTKRMHHMMIASAVVGMVGSVIGVYVSYYLNIATGPSIVLTLTAAFIVAFVLRHVLPVLRTRRQQQVGHTGNQSSQIS